MATTAIKGGIAMADYIGALLGITETVGSTAYVYTQTMGKDGTPSITKIPASFLKLSASSGGRQINIPGISESEQISKIKKVIDKIVQTGDKSKIESNNKLIFDIISRVPNIPINASADEIIKKIKRSPKVQTSIQEIINKTYPESIYQIGFGGQQPSKPSSSSSSSSSQGPRFKIPEEFPPIPPIPPQQPTPEEEKKEKKKKEKEEDKPRIPEIKEPKFDETPIAGPTEDPHNKNKHTKPNPTLWAPQYKFGGQDILRLTDTEKIEELKNWTLYDLVVPYLDSDNDNLLAVQNQIKNQLRFYNNYPLPKPPPQLPPIPQYVNQWQQPWLSTYPVPYPYQLDQGIGNRNNYYNNFSDQIPTEQNRNLNNLKTQNLNPDMSQILNSKKANNPNNILNLDLNDDDLLFMTLRK